MLPVVRSSREPEAGDPPLEAEGDVEAVAAPDPPGGQAGPGGVELLGLVEDPDPWSQVTEERNTDYEYLSSNTILYDCQS